MKTTLLFLFNLILATSAFCQTTDTSFVSITQETGVLERPRFIDQYDYLFGTKQPTRFLVKLNVVPVVLPLGEYALEDDDDYHSNILGDFVDISKAELGVEWKIVPAISLYVGGIIATRGSTYFEGHYRGGGGRVESRWYYEMPRRIRAGQSANNVSGNYISAEYQTFVQSDQQDDPAIIFQLFQRYHLNTISLRYGLQRRLGRFGFIDASIGVGYQKGTYQSNSNKANDEGSFLETRIAAGFALGSPRTPKSNVPFCDVWRCFEEDRHLWKISLAKAFHIDQASISTNPKISYEQKLGLSPFSVETEGEFFLNAYQYSGGHLRLQKYGIGFNVQPRWYFLQKHRIAKSKSGNNLAGIFGGIMGGYRYTYWANDNAGGDVYLEPNNFYIAPHFGIQQRLFKHGFINYKFGVVYESQYDLSEPSSFLSELQIGFAF